MNVAAHPRDLRVNGTRLMDRLMALADVGPIDGGGCARLALTDDDKAGRDLVVSWMRDLGLETTVDVIGNVVRTDLFRPTPRAAHTAPARLLCVALLTREKGIGDLIEAAALLVARGAPAFELVIGGDGPDRARLERLCARHGIASLVHFAGLLDRDGVRARMQACDGFILPSWAETFGLVLGEALACGRPVVATRCGGPE